MDNEMAQMSKTSWAPEIDVRVANPPPALLKKYTAKEKAFFYDYANFVVRLVRNENVTDRIHRVISIERIVIDKPVDIRVMVFPARTFRGSQNRVLHGSYSQSASQISLYPLRIPREWIRGDRIDLFRAGLEGLSQRKLRLLSEISESAVSKYEQIWRGGSGPEAGERIHAGMGRVDSRPSSTSPLCDQLATRLTSVDPLAG